jgi:AraC-like DNA-binding protein
MAWVRVHGTLFFRATLGAPWGFTVSKRKNATFHFVASGQCWLEGDGIQACTKLRTGDLVILPHGDRHTLRDDPGSPIRDLEELLSAHPVKDGCVLEYGGGGKSTVLLCGGFIAENGSANPLVASLPPLLRLPAERLKPRRWLRSALDWIISEVRERGAGSEAVTDRLAEILFIEALRAYCADCSGMEGGWVRALVDPVIGRALALIHQEPQARWTVAGIAHRFGISRSSFAAKFGHLVGEPPLQYVTRCRLGKAARLLQTSSTGIAEIAHSVGYGSVVAFHKAFKRFYQVGPAEYRRAAAPRSPLRKGWIHSGS